MDVREGEGVGVICQLWACISGDAYAHAEGQARLRVHIHNMHTHAHTSRSPALHHCISIAWPLHISTRSAHCCICCTTACKSYPSVTALSSHNLDTKTWDCVPTAALLEQHRLNNTGCNVVCLQQQKIQQANLETLRMLSARG